ncbi:MAG: aminotransferase class III-fold pyridoxal phosphate-dependent enzyme, partial [Myxococcales bacterium]|nr:aminotransferase class III-fold pyridoxal phosphate-dependent enzyme [Myxococcales bacterium]
IVREAEGQGNPDERVNLPGIGAGGAWSSTGSVLAVNIFDPTNHIEFLSAGTTELSGSFDGWFPSFSPDGRLLAYTSDQKTGANEIFIRSYPDGKIDRQVSVEGGIEPLWHPSGELFYRRGDRWFSTRVSTAPELRWDPPRQVFEKDFIHHLPSPNPYRRPEGMSVEAFCDAKVADLENKILELGPENVAVFIAEPILASGGVIVPPTGYQKKCLEICRRHDVLYISDEVVTAFGRCGHIFASEAVFDIVPDIITTAKGISSGYVPLGAVFISDRLIKEASAAGSSHSVFANGFTYSGHPASCAAGLATLDIIEREGILEHVRDITPYFQERWQELRDIPLVGDVRGVGLMACVECTIDSDSEDALKLDYEIGNRIDQHCQELGLILRPMINMCIVSPPCTITREQIDEMVRILRMGIEKAMEDVRRDGRFKR